MIRAQDFLRLASGLALSVMLGACTHQDVASTASNKTDMSQVTVGPDGMSEVVIRAQRPAAKPIVLSQHKAAGARTNFEPLQ